MKLTFVLIKAEQVKLRQEENKEFNILFMQNHPSDLTMQTRDNGVFFLMDYHSSGRMFHVKSINGISTIATVRVYFIEHFRRILQTVSSSTLSQLVAFIVERNK